LHIFLISSKKSIGIWNYSTSLAHGFAEIGVSSELLDATLPDFEPEAIVHFQFGNSTRNLLPLMKTCSGYVVTVHDVIPRNRLVRPILACYQHNLIRPRAALCIVHSRCAKVMLAKQGYREEKIAVIGHGAEKRMPAAKTVQTIKFELQLDENMLTLCFAGVIKKEKGFWDFFAAIEDYPDVMFIFVGNTGDSRIQAALTETPANVKWVPAANDEQFDAIIAASDFLVNFRKESVGETSGPVVKALAAGIYVAGYDVGFMREYVQDRGLVFPTSLSFRECLPEIVEFWKRHRQTAAPQTPFDSLLSWQETAIEHCRQYQRIDKSQRIRVWKVHS
jgi:glycosyltransferase involved in cell wall biosynthesis